jgi:RNA polymerase sigma factor (sigma-70 family)
VARDAHAAIEAVWRIESARLIAGLTRIVRDLGRAEDLAQDALLAALEKWPETGVPSNPGAWLMTAAKNRHIDLMRRGARMMAREPELERELEIRQDLSGEPDLDAMDDDVGDDLLRLVFTTCHPVLSREARVALTLRMLGGLTTPEIARAFLIPEATAAQRIVRAKRTLSEAGVRFEMPTRDETAGRLAAVLGVVYLIFNEGYAANAGEDWARPALCQEAMRLGRLLAALLPGEAEVHGLLALMELQASRLAARVDAAGEPVLLPDQDRRRWDRALIRHGLAALARAEGLGGGAYTLQAAIAACHARASKADRTDWPRIAALYEVLAHLQPTPVVLLNRAVAVGFAGDPARGLRLADELVSARALQAYPQLPGVRAELLDRLGRHDEARAEFERAAALSRNAAEQRLFRRRAAR